MCSRGSEDVFDSNLGLMTRNGKIQGEEVGVSGFWKEERKREYAGREFQSQLETLTFEALPFLDFD